MSDRAEIFSEYRPVLFSIAYRMLGSVMDAEDIVQEAFLRWQRALGEDEIASPKAYLTTVVTHLCLDQLRSARVQREVYIGPWLPEPLLVDPGPAAAVELSESLSLAFLILLESLGPVERAVFLLREVFAYEYSEIAGIVSKSEENCRQMVRRARQHLAERRPRFPVSPHQRQEVTSKFLQACGSGDMQGLVALLTEEVVLRSDGGGKVLAARNPIYGQDKVARFLAGLAGKLPPGYNIEVAETSGRVCLIGYQDGRLGSFMELALEGERICSINLVVNPDKLRGVQPE